MIPGIGSPEFAPRTRSPRFRPAAKRVGNQRAFLHSGNRIAWRCHCGNKALFLAAETKSNRSGLEQVTVHATRPADQASRLARCRNSPTESEAKEASLLEQDKLVPRPLDAESSVPGKCSGTSVHPAPSAPMFDAPRVGPVNCDPSLYRERDLPPVWQAQVARSGIMSAAARDPFAGAPSVSRTVGCIGLAASRDGEACP